MIMSIVEVGISVCAIVGTLLNLRKKRKDEDDTEIGELPRLVVN